MKDPAVISALIAFGGVIISILVTIAFGVITNRYNYISCLHKLSQTTVWTG